jgi:hypothetical protein
VKFSFVGWLFGTAALFAQPGTDSGGMYEIQGRVLDAESGAGLPHARVSLSVSSAAVKPGERTEPVVLLTDMTGSFRVTNIPAGTANLSCERIGYLPPDPPASASAMLALSNRTDRTATVTQYLRREAVIRGTVLDERGAGVGGSVQAYRLTLSDGRRVPQFGAAANVSRDGAFRVFGLKPGRYYVAFFPFPSSGGRVYRRVFYPGSADLAGARVVAIASGDDPQIDFRPASEPAGEITIKVPAGRDTASVSISPLPTAGISPEQVGSVSSNDKHTFRVTRLPSGAYIAKAQWAEDGMWTRASKRVTVHTGNSGEVALEADTHDALPLTVTYDPDAGPQPGTFIRLDSGPGTFFATADSAETPRFGQLNPGTYAVTAQGPGYIRSAHQGGRDALRDGVLVPEEGSPEPLDVSIGRHSGGFEVTADLGDTPAANPIRVAFLRQTPLGLHLEQQIFIQAPTRFQNGRYLRSLEGPSAHVSPLPGEYVIVAWTGSNEPYQLPYNEPGFLDFYASLLDHATLGEAGRQTLIIHHLLPNTAFEEH